MLWLPRWLTGVAVFRRSVLGRGYIRRPTDCPETVLRPEWPEARRISDLIRWFGVDKPLGQFTEPFRNRRYTLPSSIAITIRDSDA